MANHHRPDRRARSDYRDRGLRASISRAWASVRFTAWCVFLWVAVVLRATVVLAHHLLGSLVCLVRGHQEVDMQIVNTRARVRWCPTCLRVEWIDR